MVRTWVLLVAVVAVLAVAALVLFARSGSSTSPPLPPNCTLAVRVVGEGSVYVNGSPTDSLVAPCGSTVTLEARPDRYWRLAYWLMNNNKAASKLVLRLRLEKDTSVVAVFERLNCTVRLVANVTGARVRVNGGEVVLPYELVCPCGSKLTMEPLSLEGYRSLNGTVLFTVEENATVRLLYRRLHPAKLCSLKGGVYVSADVSGAFVVVGGRRVELPACTTPPVVLEGEWYVPLNETHGYWLAWYWVESNGVKYWWSYGLNGSKLKVDQPANVTLHYVLGLKQLPYAERILKVIPREWEVAKVKLAGRYMEVEPGTGNFSAVSRFRFMVELPENVSYIAVRLEAIGNPHARFAVIPQFLENLSDFYVVLFQPKRRGKYGLYLVLNASAFLDLYETCGLSPNNSSEVPRWLDCRDKWEEKHPHATVPVLKVNKPQKWWDIEEVSTLGYSLPPDFKRSVPLPKRENLLLLVDSIEASWFRFTIVGVAP